MVLHVSFLARLRGPVRTWCDLLVVLLLLLLHLLVMGNVTGIGHGMLFQIVKLNAFLKSRPRG